MLDLTFVDYRSLPAVFVCTLAVAYFSVKVISFLFGSTTNRLKKPPAIRSLPVIGSIPFMPRDFAQWHDFFMKKSTEMGKVLAFYRPSSQYTVILNGYDVIYEALVKKSLHFSERPIMFIDKIAFNKKGKGIIQHQFNDEFRRQQQLVLSILKELGYGTTIMQQRIHLQVKSLIERISAQSGEPSWPRTAVSGSVFRVILSITAGDCYDDELVEDVTSSIQEMFSQVKGLVIINMASMFRFLPVARRAFNTYAKNFYHLFDIYSQLIDTCTEDSFIRYYVDREGASLDHEQLLYTIRDLLIAGTETTTTQIMWAIVLLAATREGREIQAKMRREIDSVVPRDRLPALADKSSLPYVEACILEIMRFKTISPLGNMHETKCDTEVSGYFIPAGTMVFPNLYSVHMDPAIWSHPERFLPDRFLDEQGNITRKEFMVTFSLGRRSCLGELLARQEIFLFLTGLVQNFSLEPPVGSDTIELKEQLLTISMAPTPCQVRFVRRPAAADPST